MGKFPSPMVASIEGFHCIAARLTGKDDDDDDEQPATFWSLSFCGQG